jgi:hypothetical protein
MLILRTTAHLESWGELRCRETGHIEASDLHGLADGRGDTLHLSISEGATWQVIEAEDDLVVDLGGKVQIPHGTVIYSGTQEGALAIFAGGPDKIREWVCQDPAWCCWYALHEDGGTAPDTRAGACKDPMYAFRYASLEGPRPETRAAASQAPYWAYAYALQVDRGPQDETRASACGDPKWAYTYARYIDGEPREDTLRSASQDLWWSQQYNQWVDSR